MMLKNKLKYDFKKAIIGLFFAILSLGGIAGVVSSANVYADPVETTTEVTESTGDSCKNSLGALGWLVCPTTGKIAEAVDWLYDKIEEILVINPVKSEDGSPIYEIWKYCRGVTNVVFIIFLLVVIYSQITGMGISNYGVKKALPKLIVAAVLVNLSFLICSLAVDASNIVGNGLRGVFSSIAESAVMTNNLDASGDLSVEAKISYSEMYSSMAGGTALAIGGGVIAFETGAIWMLIPVVLGAIVAVASGLITIALRQAVVTLLIMISPLAMVANILPNTEVWFKKWKDLLYRMLVFYPMFSLLFGASNLAGFAIIASAKSGFWLLVGTAVQIFPLFFSWSLMKMSGTFLGNINAKLRGLAAGPLATNRAWADSHRQLTRQRMLARPRAYTPSAKLAQFLSNRKIDREAETSEKAAEIKNRGLAYHANSHYRRDGSVSRRGEEAYAAQARIMNYQRTVMRDQNNFERGLGDVIGGSRNAAQKARLRALDTTNINESDYLKAEQTRGEKIAYENATGFYQRMEDAMNAHMDDIHGVNNAKYKQHFEDNAKRAEARARYRSINQIMDGNAGDVQYAAATAAQAYDTQNKVLMTKYQKYFDMLPPSKDLEYRMKELTTTSDPAANIDAIISGLRVINQRGDTDVVLEQIENVLNSKEGVRLGTHASQSLASFLMFDVKDSDPFLRRFGKYINLETARVYNANDRKEMKIKYDEYIKGYHTETDPETGEERVMYAKKDMKQLMQGTPLDNVERTALDSYEQSLRRAYTNENGELDVKAYLDKRDEVETAIGPAFISASLKYLSGSEQLVSAVKAKTGYMNKQKDDGTYELVPIWEDDKDFAKYKDEIQKYYQRKTMQYLQDQTPSQILGLRSDYYTPLLEHLVSGYEDDEMNNWSDEEKTEHQKYIAELSDIQTRYGDLAPEEAEKLRKNDIAKLKKEMAGTYFRKILDSKGKLNQIYRTRRSGAANNAKDWVRDWLDLDNEIAITVKLEDDKRKMKKEFEKARAEKERSVAEADEPDLMPRIYSDTDMAGFVTGVEDLWQSLKDDDDEAFYTESLNYIKKELGAESFIAKMYEEFRKDDPYADGHMLKEYLTDLLNDPENY